MKKFALVLVTVLFAGMISACSEHDNESAIREPDIVQIRSICNLATLECCYHNVAKSVKSAGDGITHVGEKERKFWIEYTGTARIGIDLSKVTMRIDGENVMITIPEAELLSSSIKENELNEDSYILSEDGFFNKNKITADDQTAAIKDAQETMEESIRNNSALLLSAQNRAKDLIENYINQLGKISGVEYNIKWIYE